MTKVACQNGSGTVSDIGMKQRTGNRAAKCRKSNWVKDVFRKWAEGAGENDCDPLRIKDAPEWVFNAYVELAKACFPSGWLPAEKWDAEFLGEFLGRYYSLEQLFAGEVPLGPETKGDVEKLEAMIAGQPVPKNLREIEKDFETISTATSEAIPLATAMAAESSYSEALNFQKGLRRGIEIGPEELATSRGFRRHSRTFWVLALYWRHWAKCRSVREVYDHLCKAVGEQKIGSFKTFEIHVAKKIGLKFRGRGRPKAVH
jgi:hypothetical protein